MKKQTSKGMSLAISNAKGTAMSVMLAVVATLAWLAPAEALDGGAPRIAPPVSQGYGNTLTQWLATYFTWYYGTGQDLTQSQVGRVQLMPLPTAGDGDHSSAWDALRAATGGSGWRTVRMLSRSSLRR